MKTIGMLGGMSWESTALYYQLINQGVRQQLGRLHSAKILLHSVDFEQIEGLQRNAEWQIAADLLADAAVKLEGAGADFLLICTNTMHKVAAQIEAHISIPLLHIADATAEALVADGINSVGLLGTGFTMAEDFYKGRLTDKHGLRVVIPDTSGQQLVHDIIYNELCVGLIKDNSRRQYLRIVDQLALAGAEAVILGCTEITLLIQQPHTGVPLYDTTAIHAQRAVALAIED